MFHVKLSTPGPRLVRSVFHVERGASLEERLLGRDAVPLDEHIYVLCRVLAGLSHAHELREEDRRATGA